MGLVGALWYVDGSIVGLYLVATMIAGLIVRRYVGGVDDFLVAGREVSLYLGIASLAATEFGIATCMYTAQSGYKYGFAGATPGILQAIMMFLVGATGFCIRPMREAGVVTIPELFQTRFGPRIRWAAGLVIVLGGLLNMGVFLRVAGEFLVLVGGIQPAYLEITMTLVLVGVALYTVLGGMLSVLATDFLQFIVMSAGLIAVTLLILWRIGWNALVDTVQAAHPNGGGFNPLVNPDMGWPYVLFFSLLALAGMLTWMTGVQRLLSARDPGVAQKMYTRTSFFFLCRFLLPGIWGIAALHVLGGSSLGTALSPAELDALTPTVRAKVEASDFAQGLVVAESPQAYDQLGTEARQFTLTTAERDALPADVAETLGKTSLHAMPRFMRLFVPVGMMGLLVAAMLAAEMSTSSSYMLTWASVIYNDLMAPLRRRNWSERRGLRWNRAIVALIGVFLLFYGLWYPLKGDLWTYLGVTGTIYLSCISVLLVACCYWPRANDWGAAAAIFFGATIPVAFLVAEQVPATAGLARTIGPYFSGIAAYVIAALAMVIGSLLKPGASAGQEARS